MDPFKIHKGTTVALRDDNINTDQLMPSRYLSHITKSGFGEFLFANWRYMISEEYPESREPNMAFPLNFPEHKDATIIVTGENFAGGSSREHAVWGLTDYGFKVVIAGSFSDIFYMNSLKNGLLALTLPLEDRLELYELPADVEIAVDLEQQIVFTPNKEYPFKIDDEWRHKLLNGIDDITETLEFHQQIEDYEDKWEPFYAH